MNNLSTIHPFEILLSSDFFYLEHILFFLHFAPDLEHMSIVKSEVVDQLLKMSISNIKRAKQI